MVARKKYIIEEGKEEAEVSEMKKTSLEEASKEKESFPEKKETVVPGGELGSSFETEEIFKKDSLEEKVPPEKKDRKLFTTGLIVVLFIFGVTGWVFYLTNRFTEKTTQETTADVVGIAKESTPTPVQTQLTREEISIEILNGSGVSGAASRAAGIFEELGYQMVEIGNADETEGNELYVNSEVENLIDVLLGDAEDELDISSVSGELDDSTASARIILGK